MRRRSRQLKIGLIAVVLLSGCSKEASPLRTEVREVPAIWTMVGSGTSAEGRPFLAIGVVAGGCERFSGHISVKETATAVEVKAFNDRTESAEPDRPLGCNLKLVPAYGVAWLDQPKGERELVGECEPVEEGVSGASAKSQCESVRQIARIRSET